MMKQNTIQKKKKYVEVRIRNQKIWVICETNNVLSAVAGMYYACLYSFRFIDLIVKNHFNI